MQIINDTDNDEWIEITNDSTYTAQTNFKYSNGDNKALIDGIAKSSASLVKAALKLYPELAIRRPKIDYKQSNSPDLNQATVIVTLTMTPLIADSFKFQK